MDNKKRLFEAYVSLQQILATINQACFVFMVNVHHLLDGCSNHNDVIPRGPNPFQLQIEHINRLVRGKESHCISQLRMDRRTFMQLCIRLQNVGGVTHSRHATAMVQLMDQQWRNENGQFKPGFYAKLEESLKKTFPGTDLCAIPHIESKVKLWRKHYYALLAMLGTSGFGWNDTEKTINVDSDQVWENYVKKDGNVKGMRNKPFPYYENWCILFGKDRATGDLAEGPEEAIAAMNEEEIQTNDSPLPVENDFSVNLTMPMQSGPSSGRKRSRSETISAGLATMAEQFGNMFESTKQSMAEIAQRIGYDHDLSESRKKVNDALKMLPLETNFRLKAASIIVSDASKVDLFFSLSTDDRLEWVFMLLGLGV